MPENDLSGAPDRAVQRAQAVLTERYPELVQYLTFYGHDPDHLVIWILLRGAPDRLPAWYFAGVDQPGEQFPAELLTQLGEMRDLMVAELENVGWPNADAAHIGFDSANRVAAAGGGWNYFR